MFARLSLGSADIADDDLILIERFIILFYDGTGSAASANGALSCLFTKKGRSIENCPPTLSALLQHIYRSILKSSSWHQARNRPQPLADRSKFGWDSASLIWITIAEAAKSCQELVRCGCKKSCSGRYKCKKSRIHMCWTVSLQWWMHKYLLKLFCFEGDFLLIFSIWFLYFSEST